MRRSALSIAGIDPTAGAGLLLDVTVFALLGYRPYGVPALLTAQNSASFGGSYPVPPDFLRDEIRAVSEDARPACAKIGAVGGPENARVVADEVGGTPAVVVDPVRASSSGGVLASRYADTVRTLASMAELVTPNPREAQELSDVRVGDIASAVRAAERLAREWGCAVCVTGVAHGDEAAPVADVLWADGERTILPHPVVTEAGDPRGTGCLFSTACAAALGDGHGVGEAVVAAQGFVVAALTHVARFGRGRAQLDLASIVRDERVRSGWV